MSSSFATLEDVQLLTGKEYTETEQSRIEALLHLVSDEIRSEGAKYGKDIDAMIEASTPYGSVVKVVTVDVVGRVMRQSMDGEPMTQESQAAIGYSWSGTYAIPGGGISNALMRNDLKRLGLLRPALRTIELYSREERST